MSIYCKKTTCNLSRVPRIQPHSVGKDLTNPSPHGQQISNKILQTKTTPPTLWNAFDYVLQFKFRIMHVAGSQKTAAEFLSQLELTPKEKV